MTPPETARPAQAAPLGRGVKIALGLSLALNLLIAGIVAGVVLGRMGDMHDARGPATALRSLGLAPMIFALEPEDRAALQDRMVGARDRLRPEAAALAGSFRRFADAVAAEPYDRAAVAAALEMQRGHVRALQGEGHALLLDQLDAMTPAERSELADRLQRRLARRGGMERGEGRP